MAAARAPASDLLIVDLRDLRGQDLAPLLAEQTASWKSRFLWDFSSTAGIIRRFLDARNLHGYALSSGGRAVGYSYFIHEEGKALIGDLFVAAGYRDPASERMLLDQTLRAAVQYPGVRRIEGQLLALSFRMQEESLYGCSLRVFDRLLMIRDDLRAFEVPAVDGSGVEYRSWSDRFSRAAADLIADAYVGHVDSLINDQYRSVVGARRFLANTTHHPGCGSFLPRASMTARRMGAESLSGACLATRIEQRVGHITQLCVEPALRGRRVGYELLRRTMASLRHSSCDAVSLTVTASNQRAVALYRSLGFVVWREFPAVVWEGP